MHSPSDSVARYEDLKTNKANYCNKLVDAEEELEEEEEICSVCLVEFDRENVVNKLSRCGHVFHENCIQRWLDKNHFTCPLCRSFIFL
ncbi:putative Ring finger protein [Quillaja saponaria]|uniref:Ring finger protein n=1 Tax=Quillaja saponaria TaxID=32244 RepID=A0AAD7PGX7_QUISA|nr:putative Ring finger protein [Quillaja saponaria]